MSTHYIRIPKLLADHMLAEMVPTVDLKRLDQVQRPTSNHIGWLSWSCIQEGSNISSKKKSKKGGEKVILAIGIYLIL